MKKFINISLSLLLFFSFTTIQAQNYDYSTVPNTFSFTHDLSVGSRDRDGNPEVSYLQCVLGISPTGYFGSVTKSTLIQFQNDHAEDILKPLGLTAGSGFFGSSTRNYINQQIATDGSAYPSCNPTTTNSNQTVYPQPQPISNPTSATCPPGYMCTPNQQSQQNQQNSLLGVLPLLPYLISQPGGGQRLVYPNQPQPTGTNSSLSNFGSNMSIGSPPQSYQDPNQPAGIAPNPFGSSSGVTTVSQSGTSQTPTLGNFGGLTIRNTVVEDNIYKTCGCNKDPTLGNGKDVYYYVNENKAFYGSGGFQPIHLLIEKTISTSFLGVPPVPFTCAIGKYIPANDATKSDCLDYQYRDDLGKYICHLTWAPIEGIMTEINSSINGLSPSGSCQATTAADTPPPPPTYSSNYGFK